MDGETEVKSLAQGGRAEAREGLRLLIWVNPSPGCLPSSRGQSSALTHSAAFQQQQVDRVQIRRPRSSKGI